MIIGLVVSVVFWGTVIWCLIDTRSHTHKFVGGAAAVMVLAHLGVPFMAWVAFIILFKAVGEARVDKALQRLKEQDQAERATEHAAGTQTASAQEPTAPNLTQE